MLRFDRKQQNSVMQLSFNKKLINLKSHVLGKQNIIVNMINSAKELEDKAQEISKEVEQKELEVENRRC